MTPKLQQLVQTIVQTNQVREIKSLDLIALAELAWTEGDMDAYKDILDEVVKLNPEIKVEAGPKKFNKARIGNLPDIDID